MSQLTLVEHRLHPGNPPPSARSCTTSTTLAEPASQHRGLFALPREATKAPKTPYVVLSRIFEIGARDTLHERGLPFALLVSQVCRHWRNVALFAPTAWCAIPVHPLRAGLTEYFVSRAGLCAPLSLYFHVMSEWNLDKTLDFLFHTVHVQRIKELYVHVYRNASVSVFIWRLGRTINLPRLTHLELSWSQEADGHYLGNLPPILNINPPAKLTSLVLRGALFSVHSLTPSKMRTLTLAAPSQVVVPLSYVDFRDLLSACPMLKHLTLDGLFPVLTHGVDYPKVEHPTLTSLELIMEHTRTPAVALQNDPHYVADFLSLLHVPSVRTLTFATHWDVAWHGFACAVWAAAHALPRLAALALRLGAHARAPLHHKWFTAFPALRAVTLAVPAPAHAVPLLRVWASLLEHEGDAREAWPRLRLLTIRTVSASRAGELELDEVLALIRSRREPLEVWKSGLPEGVGHGKEPRRMPSRCVSFCKSDELRHIN